MKKSLAVTVFLLVTLSVYGQTNRTVVQLDAALKNAAEYIDARLPAGSRIALLNLTSESDKFSSYVLDELSINLVDSRNLNVVDRKDIELIRGEQSFQYSGDADDDAMVSLGRMLGAQYIVSGSFLEIDRAYRIIIRVLNVATGIVEGQYRENIIRITAGEKIGTGALNILFGLGSYLEGDIAGGLTITAGYAVTAGLFVTEAFAVDWDSPGYGVSATIGFGVAGLTLAYGFARPFIYNRSPKAVAIMDNVRPKIIMVSDEYDKNNYGLQFTYTYKY